MESSRKQLFMPSKTRMLDALRSFDWKTVREILDEAPQFLNHKDQKGRDYLHTCCMVDLTNYPSLDVSASVRIADLLIDRGLSVDAPAFELEDWHATPLWHAISRGHNLVLAAHLLKRGCNPEHCMWAAAYNDDVGAILLLFRHGAELDPVYHTDGNTPLMFAVRYRRYAAAEALMEAGADVDFPGPAGPHDPSCATGCAGPTGAYSSGTGAKSEG